jgi:hypothetical protein
MSGVLCDRCEGIFRTSEHDCGVKYVATIEQHEANIDFLHRRLETQVGEHERTKKELVLAQQGISSAVQDIKRLEAEVQKLQEEAMRRDTLPEFERGEYAGQDAMMRHLEKMDENNNSAMAAAVKKSPYVQGLMRLLAQHGDSLECASYAFGQEFDPEAAKAFHSEFCIVQKRCELFSKDLVSTDG